MEEQDYTYPGYEFDAEDHAVFLGDYTGLRLLMWARLFPDRITLVDDIELVQDGVTRDRIERWRRHGWSDVSEGRTYLFVPNIDYVGQVDRHALFSLVSNYGLEGLLDKEGLDAFLRLVRSHNAGAVEQLSVSAGIKDMNQATMSFIRNAVGGYRAAQQPTEEMEHLLEGIFRDLTAACPAFCDLNNGSDDDPMEKLHIGIHTLMSVLPEALTEHWRKSRQWRLAISPEDLAEGNDDEFRNMEARRDDLTRQPNGSIIFGTPSNALLYSSVRMKDYPIVLPYRSLFGYNGRDKQAVHPYRFDELVGLTTDIADPVAVFNAKTQGGVRSESVVVLSRLTHTEDNGEQKQFVVPISPRRDETYGSLNIVRSVYPKDDLDIMLWIAKGYLSYASDDFMQNVYEPMKKRLLASDDIRNEIKNGKMDIQLPVNSHRSRPDALRPDAESPHKEGTDSPRRSVYSVSAVADERTDAKIGNNSYPVNKISSIEELFEVADYMVERAAAGIGESDSRNIYFRVGGGDASRLDLISQADSAVRIAWSPAAAAILAMEKRSRIERYLEGIKTTPYRILNAGDPLSLEGCPAGIRDRIASAIASGLEINGFAYEGTVYVIADFIRSSEQLRSTYVHERQHILTEAEGLEDLAGISREEAFDILSRLTPEASVYEGRSTASLLSEAVSYAMEIAYSGNDDMADVLTALGITNENFKNHIQRLDYAQRHDDNLCRARYDSLVSKRFRGDGTPVRGYESQRAGEVARQRARSAVDADGVLALSVASRSRLSDLAPDGTRSTLPEDLRTEVRAESFKEWFGDWELAYQRRYAIEGDPVANLVGDELEDDGTLSLKERIGRYFLSIGGYATSPLYGKVILDTNGSSSSISHGLGREKLLAFAAVKDVIEKGIVVDYVGNHKGRGYDSVMLMAPIVIAEERYLCQVVLHRKKGFDSRFYLHEVTAEKNYLQEAVFVTNMGQNRPSALPGGLSSDGIESREKTSPGSILGQRLSDSTGDIAKIRNKILSSNSIVSMAVSESGEPKPYYYVSSVGGIIPSEDMPLTVYDTVEEAAMDIHGQNGDFFLHRVFINEKDGPVGAQFKCSDPSRLREIGDPVILSPDVTMSFANAFQKSENIPYPSSEDLELPEDTRLPDDKDADYRITRRNEDTVTGWYYKWFDSAVAAKRIPHDDFLMDGDAVSNCLYLLSQASGDERESLLASYRESQKNSFVSYISSLEGGVLQLSAARWFTMGKVRLPEDIDKVSQAVKVAAVHKVDPLTYETPMAVIDAFPSQARKDSPIDPDTVPTLHLNRRLDSGIAIYDVDESEDSRQNMRRIINTHFGKDCSPWCLLAGDQDGNLRPGTRRYWDHYSRYKKQVAFMDGRLVAFSANSVGSARYRTWWDRMDSPSSFIRRVSGMDYCGFDMNTGRLREKREDGHCLFYDEKGRLRRDGGKEYYANGRLKKDGYLRFYANGNVQWDGKTAYWSTGNPKQVTYSEKELPADIRKLLDGKWRNERYTQKCIVNYAANGTVKNIRVEDHIDPPQPGWNPCWPSRLVSFYPYSPGAVPVKRKEMLLNQHDSNDYEYTYRTWYPDGKLRVVADKVSICGADEHNRRGHYVSYYPNGNVKFEGDYDSKLPESVRQSFWPDGSPRQREVYTHNGYEWKLRDSSSWYENGKTRSTVEMIGDDSGQREYRIKIYHPDGTLKTDADNATMAQRVVNGKVSAVVDSPRRKDYDTDGHILSEVHNDTSIKYNDDGLPLRYVRREQRDTSIILTMDGNKPASLRVSSFSDVLSFSLSETGGVTGGKQSVLKTIKIGNDKLRTVYAEQKPLSVEQLSAVSDTVLQFVKHVQDLSDDGSTNHLTFKDFRIALGQFSKKEYIDPENLPFRMDIPVGIDDAASDTNDISEWVATLSEDERKSLLRQNGLSEDLSLESVMNGDVAVDGDILVGLYGDYISSVEKEYAYRPGLATDITKTVQPVGKNDMAADARLGKMKEYELAMNRWRGYKWYEKLFIPKPKKPKAELKDTRADDAQRPNNGLPHTGNESKPESSPIHYGSVSRKDIEILESYRLLSAGDGSLERFIAEIEKKKEVVVTGNMTYQRTHAYDPALLPTQKVCIGLRMDPSGSLVVFNPDSRKELGTVRNVLSQVPHDGAFAVKPREARQRRAEKEIRHQESAARSPRRGQPG